LKDSDAFGVGFLNLWDDNLVHVKRGFVEYDFGLSNRGEVHGFVHEEIHDWNNSSIDEAAYAEGKLESQILDNETCNELAILC